MSEDRYLKITEVADRYGIHRVTVYRKIEAGKLPRPVSIGGMPRWSLAALKRWENAQARKAKALG